MILVRDSIHITHFFFIIFFLFSWLELEHFVTIAFIYIMMVNNVLHYYCFTLFYTIDANWKANWRILMFDSILMLGDCAGEILTLELVFRYWSCKWIKIPVLAAKYPCGVLLRKIRTCWQMFRCVAQWLATWTRKPKVSSSSPTASYGQRRALCSNYSANV